MMETVQVVKWVGLGLAMILGPIILATPDRLEGTRLFLLGVQTTSALFGICLSIFLREY